MTMLLWGISEEQPPDHCEPGGRGQERDATSHERDAEQGRKRDGPQPARKQQQHAAEEPADDPHFLAQRRVNEVGGPLGQVSEFLYAIAQAQAEEAAATYCEERLDGMPARALHVRPGIYE